MENKFLTAIEKKSKNFASLTLSNGLRGENIRDEYYHRFDRKYKYPLLSTRAYQLKWLNSEIVLNELNLILEQA